MSECRRRLELGLVFLGSGAASPNRYRGLPSIAVVYRGSVILLDAGEGTQFALARAGIGVQKINSILITHLHGDHLFGLPGLLQSMAMAGRRELLVVAGPRGLRDYLENISKTTMWIPSYPLVVAELVPGDKLSLPNGFRVEAIRAEHIVPALAYRLEEPSRSPRVKIEEIKKLGIKPGPYIAKLLSGEKVVVDGVTIEPSDVVEERKPAVIVYSGDTRPIDDIVRAAEKATILIHDSTFSSIHSDKAVEQGHSTASDAARAADRAGVELLVLFHISARYENPLLLYNEARKIFEDVVLAEDFLKIVVRL